jgi:hypothetical protein
MTSLELPVSTSASLDDLLNVNSTATRTSNSTAESNSTADVSHWLCECCGSDAAGEGCYPRLLKVVEALDLYLIPIIVGVGIVGNTVSFLVFTATYLRRMSSSVYLAALAVVDTVFLILVFLTWLSNFGIQVRDATRESSLEGGGSTESPQIPSLRSVDMKVLAPGKQTDHELSK